MSSDKNWAVKYVLDPLNAPAPSDETGPGSQTLAPVTKQQGQNSFRSKSLSSPSRRHQVKADRGSAYPTPPSSASPTSAQFPQLESFSQHQGGQTSNGNPAPGNPGRRRVSSLSSRFPGDKSHKPLDILRHENKVAQRSPHLRRGHLPGPDTIDSLDNIVGRYHHEGPYDAALRARNVSPKESPLEAIRSTNEEALRATPLANIKDSLESHRPLDGVAAIPPGMKDLSGQTMQYEEGTDMMIEHGGNYKRWPGVDYLPEDLKGKGEPSYSIEKALKQTKRQSHQRTSPDGGTSFEMTTNQRPTSAGYQDMGHSSGAEARYADWQGDIRRSNTTSGSIGKGLRRKFGSLRRK